MKIDGDRLPLVLAATVPVLVLRLGAEYLRFLGKRRSGVRAFHGALVAGGMSPTLADRLAATYHEAGSIPRILREAGIPGLR